MSMPSSVALTPNCSLSRARSATSPACSSALVGMQPRCRQVPPELVLVDQRHAHAELRGAQRARVATAAAAQDDEVDVGLSHRGSPSWSRRTGGGRLPIATYPHLGTRTAAARGWGAGGSALLGDVLKVATSARTGTPVPPFGVYPHGSPVFKAGPATSTCTQATPSATNSRRNSPPTSIPPDRSPETLAMSATPESSPCAAPRAAASATCPRRPGRRPRPPGRAARRCPSPRRSGRPARPAARRSACDVSIRYAGESSQARTIASARISRPSASVLSTSTRLPPYMVSTSAGRYAEPLGRFSAIGTVGDHLDRQVELGDRGHGGDHRGGAGHVGLHLVHARRTA